MQASNGNKLTFLVCFFTLVSGSVALAQSYSFRGIDVPGAASTASFANNDAGQIVGEYTLGPCCLPAHAYDLNRGSFGPIAFPGAATTIAYGINNKGEVVGIYSGSSGTYHGFMRKGNTYTAINYPAASSTLAEFANDRGTVVGGYYDGTRYHGFFFENGNYTPFDFPGAASTFGFTINNAGQVVGAYSLGDPNLYTGLKGFVLSGTGSGGTYTSIAFPGAIDTVASGINNSGEIVGYYTDSGGAFHGFTLVGGNNYRTLDFPGATGTILAEANNIGQIVGQYTGPYGSLDYHGFLATPVPGASAETSSISAQVGAGTRGISPRGGR